MANKQPPLLPKDVVLRKLERVTDTLIGIGQAFEQTEQTEFANIITQAVKDMTAIHGTISQL